MSLRTGTDRDLLKELSQMDGRPYGAYRSLAGTWDYGDFTVAIDRVQSDPYAPPSVLRAWTTPSGMGLPDEALASSQARLAAADYLARIFYDAAHARAGRDVQIPRPRQEVLQRSYALVLPDRVEVRFQVRLPARGRTILGRTAARLFDVDVPNIIMDCFDFVTDDEATNTKRRGLLTHIAAYEDYCALRGALDENGWVAFVADGAVLARRSGVSQLPLAHAVPFISPAALRASVDLPHAGVVTGLAIPPGITLIAGGGYHGKSTLLSAIARGVYAHIPGDGRELVATTPNAMKIRAADGRSITDVDISPFIGGLPGGADTTAFSTANASGSTSQAAAISEAVELGSPLLLIDEDTSATNLLIRDARMRSLVTHEPITPLVDRARGLAEAGTSLIMVVGGSGDYLDVADRVLLMDEYLCHDATERARAIVAEAKRRGLTHVNELHAEVEYVVAHGISTRIDGLGAVIGSAHFVFEDEGVPKPEGIEEAIHEAAPTASVVYMAQDGVLVGAFCISDPLRDEAAGVLAQLRSLGIERVVMLTGDAETSARYVADRLGIDVCHAQVLPEDKSFYVGELRRQGHVVIMVGDGINDSPALAAADVSVALSDASDIARAVADVSVLDASLESLVTMRCLAQRLMARIHRDYRFIVGFNTGLIALGVAGALPLTTAAYLHNVSTLAVTGLNARPLLPRPRR